MSDRLLPIGIARRNLVDSFRSQVDAVRFAKADWCQKTGMLSGTLAQVLPPLKKREKELVDESIASNVNSEIAKGAARFLEGLGKLCLGTRPTYDQEEVRACIAAHPSLSVEAEAFQKHIVTCSSKNLPDRELMACVKDGTLSGPFIEAYYRAMDPSLFSPTGTSAYEHTRAQVDLPLCEHFLGSSEP